MKLIIGLGNPEKKYQNTRHNLGQNIILKLIENQKLILKNYPKLGAKIIKDKALLAISTEYMNNSGITVQKILNFYKISPQDLYVVHDDLDLPVGEYRIQFDRGPAGHNGIQSIIDHLGTQAFHRIRVGIGHPKVAFDAKNNIPVEDYVLLPFTKEEKTIIDNLIPEVIQKTSEI